jgi:hypothetical protein
LFQNGYVNSHRCGKAGMNTEYALMLALYILPLRDTLLPQNTIPQNFSLDQSDAFSILAQTENAHLNLLEPLALHYNYNKQPKKHLMTVGKTWIFNAPKSYIHHDNKHRQQQHTFCDKFDLETAPQAEVSSCSLCSLLCIPMIL